MKILLPTFLLATLITVVACNNNNTAETETIAPTQPVSTGVNDTINNAAGVNTNSVPVAPSTIQPQQGGVALNPPHGQPGHNCDIEVGKPLNSAPTSNTAPPIMTTPAQSPTVVPSNPSTPLPSGINSGQVKLNPAHGLPGHRCDIAVGAAL